MAARMFVAMRRRVRMFVLGEGDVVALAAEIDERGEGVRLRNFVA